MPATIAVRTDEAAARRDLREQIGRLERELACALAAAFPRREPDVGRGRSASCAAGPRLLGLGELEAVRDERAGRQQACQGPGKSQ